MAEPVMEPELVATEAAAAILGGFVSSQILLAIIAAAVSSGSRGGLATSLPNRDLSVFSARPSEERIALGTLSPTADLGMMRSQGDPFVRE